MVGNISNYTSFDLIRCFLAISDNISRSSLVNKLDLGEGTIRSILDVLKKKKLIASNQGGHSYSAKGKVLYQNIKGKIEIKRLESKDIYHNYKKIALLVKGNNNIDIDYKLRDIAVKNGAEGALILNYKKKLILPGLNDFSSKELDNLFNYSNGNLLIVSFSPSMRWSENASLAVASEVDPTLKNILNI